MTAAASRVLVLAREPATGEVLRRLLPRRSETIAVVAVAREARRAVAAARTTQPDVILAVVAARGPGRALAGLVGLVGRLREAAPSGRVIVLGRGEDVEGALAAVRAGAAGYLDASAGIARIARAVDDVRLGGLAIDPGMARQFWYRIADLRACGAAEPVDAQAQEQQQQQQQTELPGPDREVLELLARGLTNAEIAGVLGLARRTVRTRLGHLYRRLGVRGHAEAVASAVRRGVITP